MSSLVRYIFMFGVFVGLFVLAFDAYISHFLVEKFSLYIHEKNEKLDDIANFKEYLSEIKDAETGQRGYIITGDRSYLEPYEKGLEYINSEEIQEFFGKFENLKDEIIKLKTLTTVKTDELKLVIEKFNTSGFQNAKEEVSKNLGKKSMDDIRSLINTIISKKYQELAQQDEQNNSYFKIIIYIILAINILFLAFCSVFLYVFYH